MEQKMENEMDTGGNNKNTTGSNSSSIIILAHPCDLWSSVSKGGIHDFWRRRSKLMYTCHTSLRS